jgi:hypothetical protein
MITKWDAGTAYPSHQHFGGEEFLLLQGDLYDHVSTHNQGVYCRYPINSIHEPSSMNGCIFLVRIKQMTEADEEEDHTIVDTNDINIWLPVMTNRGRSVCQLFKSKRTNEYVCMERWVPNTVVDWIVAANGEEILILEGDLTVTYLEEQTGEDGIEDSSEYVAASDNHHHHMSDTSDSYERKSLEVDGNESSNSSKAPKHKTYTAGWWIRRPSSFVGKRLTVSTESGVKFYMKQGHHFPLIQSDKQEILS